MPKTFFVLVTPDNICCALSGRRTGPGVGTSRAPVIKPGLFVLSCSFYHRGWFPVAGLHPRQGWHLASKYGSLMAASSLLSPPSSTSGRDDRNRFSLPAPTSYCCRDVQAMLLLSLLMASSLGSGPISAALPLAAMVRTLVHTLRSTNSRQAACTRVSVPKRNNPDEQGRLDSNPPGPNACRATRLPLVLDHRPCSYQ